MWQRSVAFTFQFLNLVYQIAVLEVASHIKNFVSSAPPPNLLSLRYALTNETVPKKWNEMKAKTIISAFPCLAYAGDKPRWTFYEWDVRGYLEIHLVHARKDLSLDDRKRKNEKVTDKK